MGDFNLDLLKFSIHKPTEEFIDLMYAGGLIPQNFFKKFEKIEIFKNGP